MGERKFGVGTGHPPTTAQHVAVFVVTIKLIKERILHFYIYILHTYYILIFQEQMLNLIIYHCYSFLDKNIIKYYGTF